MHYLKIFRAERAKNEIFGCGDVFIEVTRGGERKKGPSQKEKLGGSGLICQTQPNDYNYNKYN